MLGVTSTTRMAAERPHGRVSGSETCGRRACLTESNGPKDCPRTLTKTKMWIVVPVGTRINRGLFEILWDQYEMTRVTQDAFENTFKMYVVTENSGVTTVLTVTTNGNDNGGV